MVFVAKKGAIIAGSQHNVDGQRWVHVSPKTCDEVGIIGGEAWVLMHGGKLGLGDLLRPIHDQVEHLEELLWRMAGDCGDRVRPLVDVLDKAGIRTASDLLIAKRSEAGCNNLKRNISDEMLEFGSCAPELLLDGLTMAVEDSRMSFGGFPQTPPLTKVRVLFTAPHSLPLCREGHRPHQPEAHTSRLAREFAHITGGCFLTWAQYEERRANQHFKKSGQPDPSNQDPNYMHRDFLEQSPWTRNLKEVRWLYGYGWPCLHVDLHGCKDPTHSGGAHVVVGLRAAEFAGRAGVENFRTVLQKTLCLALRGVSVNVRPLRQLTGALEDDFHTLTQQSIGEPGGCWTCAAQIEMSWSLRKVLAENKEVQTLTAQAIVFAWSLASRDASDSAATLHALQYWVARCKSINRRFADGGVLGPGFEVISIEDKDDDKDDWMEAAAETANSEPRPAGLPHDDEALETLQAELLLQGKALTKRSTNCNLLPNRPTLVDFLRSWLRCSFDLMPSLDPGRQYHIVGTWRGWRPVPMHWDGSNFVHNLTVGARGWECFQILVNGEWDQTLYPSVPAAGLTVEHTLEGPDRNGNGKNWYIGDPKNTFGNTCAARQGENYRIVLLIGEKYSLDDDVPACELDMSPTKVCWELLGLPGGELPRERSSASPRVTTQQKLATRMFTKADRRVASPPIAVIASESRGLEKTADVQTSRDSDNAPIEGAPVDVAAEAGPGLTSLSSDIPPEVPENKSHVADLEVSSDAEFPDSSDNEVSQHPRIEKACSADDSAQDEIQQGADEHHEPTPFEIQADQSPRIDDSCSERSAALAGIRDRADQDHDPTPFEIQANESPRIYDAPSEDSVGPDEIQVRAGEDHDSTTMEIQVNQVLGLENACTTDGGALADIQECADEEHESDAIGIQVNQLSRIEDVSSADSALDELQHSIAQDHGSTPVEIQALVHIDRSLGLMMAVTLPGGSNVAALKAELALMDPTGQTDVQDIFLRKVDSADGDFLDDSAILKGPRVELDICLPG